MSNPQQFCIFCGQPRLSKEHLFPGWLRKYFPRSADDSHTFGRISDRNPTWDIQSRQGHSGSKKVRKVCKRCNSGWISGLDKSASNIFPPFIEGTPTEVTPEMQRATATWLVKIAMVSDSLPGKSSRVTQDHRTHLMTHLGAPDG